MFILDMIFRMFLLIDLMYCVMILVLFIFLGKFIFMCMDRRVLKVR